MDKTTYTKEDAIRFLNECYEHNNANGFDDDGEYHGQVQQELLCYISTIKKSNWEKVDIFEQPKAISEIGIAEHKEQDMKNDYPMKGKKPLAIATITNTCGLAIYEMTSDKVLVGVNDEEPVWIDIEHDSQGEPYIDCYGKTYLDEFIKQQ